MEDFVPILPLLLLKNSLCFFIVVYLNFLCKNDLNSQKQNSSAEIALLLTNQIAGNAIDFKMNVIINLDIGC